MVVTSSESTSSSRDSFDDGPENHPCDGSASSSSLVSLSVFVKLFYQVTFTYFSSASLPGPLTGAPVDAVSVVSVAVPVAGVGAASVSATVVGAAAGPVVISLPD